MILTNFFIAINLHTYQKFLHFKLRGVERVNKNNYLVFYVGFQKNVWIKLKKKNFYIFFSFLTTKKIVFLNFPVTLDFLVRRPIKVENSMLLKTAALAEENSKYFLAPIKIIFFFSKKTIISNSCYLIMQQKKVNFSPKKNQKIFNFIRINLDLQLKVCRSLVMTLILNQRRKIQKIGAIPSKFVRKKKKYKLLFSLSAWKFFAAKSLKHGMVRVIVWKFAGSGISRNWSIVNKVKLTKKKKLKKFIIKWHNSYKKKIFLRRFFFYNKKNKKKKRLVRAITKKPYVIKNSGGWGKKKTVFIKRVSCVGKLLCHIKKNLQQKDYLCLRENFFTDKKKL